MLEKPGAKNIAVCENQGKQHELSDQLKSCFWKKKQRMGQKRQKIQWNTSFNKRFLYPTKSGRKKGKLHSLLNQSTIES